jgi:hypothetical protein
MIMIIASTILTVLCIVLCIEFTRCMNRSRHTYKKINDGFRVDWWIDLQHSLEQYSTVQLHPEWKLEEPKISSKYFDNYNLTMYVFEQRMHYKGYHTKVIRLLDGATLQERTNGITRKANIIMRDQTKCP